jgi:AcrR family transcriptional regulator
MDYSPIIVIDSPTPTSPEDLPSPPAAPRRARKKARTRAEIFDAAMALFDREGFASVTVARICTAADVARATFFLHFPSKSTLLLELDRRLAAELRGRLRSLRGSAVSEYRTAADLLGQRWPHPSDVLAAMLHEQRSPETALAPEESRGQALRGVVEDIVRRGQERGEFRRNVSARLAATVFLSTSAAVFSGAVYAEGEATLEEIRNQLLHAVLHGLLEPKPRLKWRRPQEGANSNGKS